MIQWNLSITTTSYDTSLSSRAHPGGPGPPEWSLKDRESDKMGNYSSSVCINHFTKWTTGNRLHYKGGRYWQVPLYGQRGFSVYQSFTLRQQTGIISRKCMAIAVILDLQYIYSILTITRNHLSRLDYFARTEKLFSPAAVYKICLLLCKCSCNTCSLYFR